MMSNATSQQVWEYHVIDVHARHVQLLQDKLNELAGEGWELLFMNEPAACQYRCVFRRTVA